MKPRKRPTLGLGGLAPGCECGCPWQGRLRNWAPLPRDKDLGWGRLTQVHSLIRRFGPPMAQYVQVFTHLFTYTILFGARGSDPCACLKHFLIVIKSYFKGAQNYQIEILKEFRSRRLARHVMSEGSVLPDLTTGPGHYWSGRGQGATTPFEC